jgi:penicillin V acylase-like amidase (Ntn superfamily)
MLLITTAASQVSACTGFIYSDEETVLVGNNEDIGDYNFNLRFFPAKSDKHGMVCFEIAELQEDGTYLMTAYAGMNDQGAWFSAYGTPYLKPLNSLDKPHFTYSEGYYKDNIGEYCLAECSTVNEAIDIIDDYNLEDWATFQVFMVDSTGNSVIIEGDDIIYKEGAIQVVSNFLQSHPELGELARGFERYNIAMSMLENMSEPSIEYFQDICNATHLDGTVYSMICDIENQVIYLYFLHNYEKLFVIDLNEELAKGEHSYYIGSLFEPDENQPPEKPAAPTGIEEPGETGVDYQVKCRKINDPNEDEISYCFDWGDGTYSHWITSHYGMSTVVSASHNWTEEGTYEVKVKARDQYGAESDWSDPLQVTMPKNKITNFYEIILWRLIERYPILEYLL